MNNILNYREYMTFIGNHPQTLVGLKFTYKETVKHAVCKYILKASHVNILQTYESP